MSAFVLGITKYTTRKFINFIQHRLVLVFQHFLNYSRKFETAVLSLEGVIIEEYHVLAHVLNATVAKLNPNYPEFYLEH